MNTLLLLSSDCTPDCKRAIQMSFTRL